MKVIYSDQPIDDNLSVKDGTIFLVGPTARTEGVKSWRPEALDILRDLGYQGVVFVPEPVGTWPEFNIQVEWEWKALNSYGVKLFWVPRHLYDLVGLTTNVEFGYYLAKGNVLVYGRPSNAPHTQYLDWLWHKHSNILMPPPIQNTLKSTLEVAMEIVQIQTLVQVIHS
jgi:hypothetical protein